MSADRDRLIICEPIRRRQIGLYKLRVGTVDGHRSVIVQHPDLGTAVMHFIRKPHEADDLFDSFTEDTIGESFPKRPAS